MEINGLAKVNAPVNVNVIIREKDDKLLINFVNLSSGKTLSPRNAMIEEVPPVGPISISMRLDKEPSKVFLAPSNTPVEWEFEKDFSQSESGLFKAKINFIGIHDILVIS